MNNITGENGYPQPPERETMQHATQDLTFSIFILFWGQRHFNPFYKRYIYQETIIYIILYIVYYINQHILSHVVTFNINEILFLFKTDHLESHHFNTNTQLRYMLYVK